MPMQPFSEIDLFDVWGLDLKEPYPSSCDNTFILVTVVYVSKWVEAVALPSSDAKVVLRFLHKHIFTRFGTPRAFISDEGSEFIGRQVFNALQRYRVKHHIATSYHPQTNGQDNVSNRKIKQILEKWDAVLKKISAALVKDGKFVFSKFLTSVLVDLVQPHMSGATNSSDIVKEIPTTNTDIRVDTMEAEIKTKEEAEEEASKEEEDEEEDERPLRQLANRKKTTSNEHTTARQLLDLNTNTIAQDDVATEQHELDTVILVTNVLKDVNQMEAASQLGDIDIDLEIQQATASHPKGSTEEEASKEEEDEEEDEVDSKDVIVVGSDNDYPIDTTKTISQEKEKKETTSKEQTIARKLLDLNTNTVAHDDVATKKHVLEIIILVTNVFKTVNQMEIASQLGDIDIDLVQRTLLNIHIL
ncbi:uncharacterized protein LOC120208210 [Hibiscus syriacus]|uniref:uncharacterized protein LOC120208210 n=1 Tax=Hibiscus syriacus TaxID=106335 RepID=UPI00192066D1|nr:uncharacterized protein LOC120208210 [Hibiscus syriacus]